MTELRRTYSNRHPTRRIRWGNSSSEEPLTCFSQVLVVTGNGNVAISMNGTTVMTAAQFRAFSRDILEELDSA